jgi:hypothetical protein
MPEREFVRFVEKARRLRAKPAKAHWTSREIALIATVNASVLAAGKQSRFDELVSKRRAEIISEGELKELIALTEEAEKLNVERVEALAKLAKLRKKTLPEIMAELEICPPPAI